MSLLDKYIAATDSIRRGFTARGIANGLPITRGFSFPRIAGGYNLYRGKDTGTPPSGSGALTEFRTMSAYGDYLEQKNHQNWLKTGASVPQPTGLHLALFNVSGFPDEGNNTTNEKAFSGGYARQNVTTLFSQSGGNASQAENNAAITFAVATASWGTIYGWAIYDASTGGNKRFKGSWATAKMIETNDQFQVGAGDLTIAFD